MAKSPRTNPAKKVIDNTPKRGTRKKTVGLAASSCCPDPGSNNLPDGTIMVVIDGEWMPLHPGTEGQVLSIGPGGSLIWIDP
jgi:hypothetical protein